MEPSDVIGKIHVSISQRAVSFVKSDDDLGVCVRVGGEGGGLLVCVCVWACVSVRVYICVCVLPS